MNNDIIKLLNLEQFNLKIERIDITKVNNILYVYITLKNLKEACPACSSLPIIHGYKIKTIKHSISNNNPCFIIYKARRFYCKTCKHTYYENNQEEFYRVAESKEIEKDEITIRDFTETDLPLMLKWLTDKRVLEYYEGRDVRFTMDTLSAHFLEEIPDGFRMIIEYKKSPIGYAQAYQLSGELFDEYDYPDDGHIVFAMDQFIGEPKYWSKGIGSSFLKMMASHLKENMAAERVLLDPHQDNKRAIRAYEKAGFKIIKSLPKHEMFEGEKVDCWLMELAL